MRVEGMNGMDTGNYMGLTQGADATTKNIQNQIANAQKQLQRLSENDTMSPEEKMKKRQEINQQINDLNNQLRQHQIELRKQKQQSEKTSMDDMLGSPKASKDAGGTGLSQASMQAMISADSSIKQAQTQGSVANQLKGRAGVLKAEIKQDAGRGGTTESKKEELGNIEQAAENATASQLNSLNTANQAMKEAAKADQEDGKKVETEQKQDKATSNKDTSNKTVEENQGGKKTALQTYEYRTVDIRL